MINKGLGIYIFTLNMLNTSDVCCWFLLLGMNSSDSKCGYVSVEVANPNPQPPAFLRGVKNPFSGQPLSFTSQGHSRSQMGLAAYSPSLHSYLQRLESSLCKPQAPAPEKCLGQADDYIKWTGLPSVTICAKCPVLSLTPARFVIIPIHALSLFLLSAHSSLSVSLTQSQSISLPYWHSLSCFVSYATDSSVTLRLFRFSKPFRLSKGTSVRVTYHHHNSHITQRTSDALL